MVCELCLKNDFLKTEKIQNKIENEEKGQRTEGTNRKKYQDDRLNHYPYSH